jgi:hypothetical protein
MTSLLAECWECCIPLASKVAQEETLVQVETRLSRDVDQAV